MSAVFALAAGCAAPPPQRMATYMSPTLPDELPARVVVVPFSAPACTADDGPMVTQSMALAIQSTLLCDVVPARAEDERLAAESALWQRGKVDVESLVVARKNYMADAFLFGTITQYKPYDPPILGLKLRMLSARTGDVLWAAEALFDAHDQTTRSKARDYFKDSGLRGRLYGPDLMFMSPKLYAGFVASEIARPLGERIQRERASVAAGK